VLDLSRYGLVLRLVKACTLLSARPDVVTAKSVAGNEVPHRAWLSPASLLYPTESMSMNSSQTPLLVPCSAIGWILRTTVSSWLMSRVSIR
jgi:hypothetical protein